MSDQDYYDNLYGEWGPCPECGAEPSLDKYAIRARIRHWECGSFRQPGRLYQQSEFCFQSWLCQAYEGTPDYKRLLQVLK